MKMKHKKIHMNQLNSLLLPGKDYQVSNQYTIRAKCIKLSLCKVKGVEKLSFKQMPLKRVLTLNIFHNIRRILNNVEELNIFHFESQERIELDN